MASNLLQTFENFKALLRRTPSKDTHDKTTGISARAVEPVECLKGAWELIKDQYWLFFGLVLVGLIIGGAVPLGILMGPMMCGLFLTYFRKRKGLPIEFGTMFKGFDYFGQSIVAALLHVVPLTVVIIGAYIFLYVGMFAAMLAGAAAGDDAAAPVMGLGFVFLILIFYIFVLLAVILISIGFTFAYPLIVDRNMSGFDAVKLSFRAAFANFWRFWFKIWWTARFGWLMSLHRRRLPCYPGNSRCFSHRL